MDLEFLTALAQLSQAASDRALRTTDTGVVLARLVAIGWPPSLLADYNLLRTCALRMRLLRDRPQDVIGPADVVPLARSLEQDPVRLLNDLDAAMARVARCFADRFP